MNQIYIFFEKTLHNRTRIYKIIAKASTSAIIIFANYALNIKIEKVYTIYTRSLTYNSQ